MNDAVEALAIGCSLALFLGIIFGFLAFVRYLRYRETIALAERGLIRPSGGSNGNGRNTLRWGLVIFFLGLALCIGTWPIGFLISPTGFGRAPFGFGPWMLVGLIPMFFGLALIALYFIARGNGANESWPSGAEDERDSKYDED